MSGFLDKTGLAHLWEKMKSALSDKQDKLTAGTGITIQDNVISAEASSKQSLYVYDIAQSIIETSG